MSPHTPAPPPTSGPKREPTARRASPRSELQRQSILDAASRLFLEKGFGGTNLNDIADVLGVSRTALYYYFRSKEAILEALTEDVTEAASALASSVSVRDGMPPEAALRQLVIQHATLILTHTLQFRVVERSEKDLPAERRAAAQAARRALLEHFVDVIERGVASGDFRAPDARVAAFAILGMCNWSAWWFKPDAGMPAEDVAKSLAEFAMRSLLRDDARPPPPATVAESIGMLQEGLARLAEQVDASTRRR